MTSLAPKVAAQTDAARIAYCPRLVEVACRKQDIAKGSSAPAPVLESEVNHLSGELGIASCTTNAPRTRHTSTTEFRDAKGTCCLAPGTDTKIRTVRRDQTRRCEHPVALKHTVYNGHAKILFAWVAVPTDASLTTIAA